MSDQPVIIRHAPLTHLETHRHTVPRSAATKHHTPNARTLPMINQKMNNHLDKIEGSETKEDKRQL